MITYCQRSHTVYDVAISLLLLQQQQIIMGSHHTSNFSQRALWKVLDRTPSKELLQHHQTAHIYQKHILTGILVDNMRIEGPIFQWRQHNNNHKLIVQIVQMTYHNQDDPDCQFQICEVPQGSKTLTVYTEHLHKLYEYNSRQQLSVGQQWLIVGSIIQAVVMLAAKFGCFCITKDMVGYSEGKLGKAWINDNFAINYPQIKQKVVSQPERDKWERQIVSSLLDFCELCSTERKRGKFYAVVQEVRAQQLYSFNKYRKHLKNVLQRERIDIKYSIDNINSINHIKSSVDNIKSSVENRPFSSWSQSQNNYNSRTKQSSFQPHQSSQAQYSKVNNVTPMAARMISDPSFNQHVSQRHKITKTLHENTHKHKNRSLTRQPAQNSNHKGVVNSSKSKLIDQRYELSLNMHNLSLNIPHNISLNTICHEHSVSSNNRNNQHRGMRSQSDLSMQVPARRWHARTGQEIALVDSMIVVQRQSQEQGYSERQCVIDESVILRGISE